MMDSGISMKLGSQNNCNTFNNESYAFFGRTFTPATRVRIPLGTPTYFNRNTLFSRYLVKIRPHFLFENGAFFVWKKSGRFFMAHSLVGVSLFSLIRRGTNNE